jgi:hypothetical protein
MRVDRTGQAVDRPPVHSKAYNQRGFVPFGEVDNLFLTAKIIIYGKGRESAGKRAGWRVGEIEDFGCPPVQMEVMPAALG